MAKEKEIKTKKPSERTTLFDIINYIVFIIIGLIILVPIWKVIVDSWYALLLDIAVISV